MTATRIFTDGPGFSDDQDIAGSITTTRIKVRLGPEPGMLLLLGSGAALVALLGWRRR